MPRLLLDFSHPVHRKRFTLLLVVLFVLIALLYVVQSYAIRRMKNDWSNVKQQEERVRTEYIQQSFRRFQQEVADVVMRVKSDSGILTSLKNNTDGKRALFSRLQSLDVNQCSVELFDSSGVLQCWIGKEGIASDSYRLHNKVTSFVVQGPIYSYLLVTSPLVDGNPAYGTIVAKRLFDVKYPISNRFINERVFAQTFAYTYGIEAEFNFSNGSNNGHSEEEFSVPLKNINGDTIGKAILSSVTEEIKTVALVAIFQKVLSSLVFIVGILVFAGIASVRIIRRSPVFSTVFGIAAIWLMRYLCVYLDFPSSVFSLSIFEPSYFASPFGYGIAKSIGDFVISACCLLASVAIVIRSLLKAKPGKGAIASWTIAASIFAIVLPLLLRGYAATLRSAVFDSTINYNDRLYIIPAFEHGMMLIGLFLVALSLSLASIGGIIILRQRFLRIVQGENGVRLAIPVIFLLLAAGSLLVGVFHPNPLFGQLERLYFIAGFTVGAFIITGMKQLMPVFSAFRTAVVTAGISTIILIMPLDANVHESDRAHAEFLASNIFRPADNYLSLLTEQTLKELVSNNFVEELQDQNPEVVKQVAFKSWAQSMMSREGYNCSVTYYSSAGSPLSQFYVGADWTPVAIPPESLTYAKPVHIEERALKSGLVRIYKGYRPIFLDSSRVIGGVSIEVSAGKQALLGGETPEFLRNYPTGDDEAQHRSLIYTEYLDGKLAYSSSPIFHAGLTLPPFTDEQKATDGFWIMQPVDTLEYESYFFLTDDAQKGRAWHALSMKQLDFGWHLYHTLRVAFFVLLCLMATAGCILVVRVIRGTRVRLSFRSKLMGAFFIVALIPTGILAYYNRQYAMDRFQQSTIDQLQHETITIASALQSQWSINSPFDLYNFTDQDAIHAAEDFITPFSLFDGTFETASSTPELFRAELFDYRMPADAHLNIVLNQKSFYATVQSIGTLQYIVGYSPLLEETGRVFGVVSVPTLFRLREIDRELVRRNAYLFGAFIFAMLIALMVSIVFSQQISAPVRRLHQATRELSTGNFNISLTSKRVDEFGELERSFASMLTDLQKIQTEMMKTQRELAWKEMAKQVAHEIKNPLTPMKLSLQHLRQAYQDKIEDFDTLLQQVTATSLEQIETLNRIASEFSHFARMPERKIEQCDLHRVLREVTALFGEHAFVIFDLQFSSNSAIILADKEELRRMFINLVKNSVQAMNEQGTLTLRTEAGERTVNIMLKDTGGGISPEIRDRLFEPNFSTKTDGMGLGLAIVKKTIDDLSGSISIESEQGKGATVSIELPVAGYLQS